MADYTKHNVKVCDLTSDEKIDLCYDLLQDIRDEDLRDLSEDGADPCFLLIASINLADEIVVYRNADNELLLVCGIGKDADARGGRFIWMVGCNRLQTMSNIKTLLMKESKRLIAEWLDKYILLYNCVHVDNEKSKRWLTYLGAIWLPDFVGPDNKFQSFVIVKGAK